MVDDMSLSKPSQRSSALILSPLLLGVLLIAANLRAPITSLGPVLSEVNAWFGLTPFSAGLLNALPLLIFGVASPLAPWIMRKGGLEKALMTGLVLIALGCLLRSLAGVAGLWAGTVLIGLGIAIANVLLVPLIKREFPAQTALCIGLYAASMALIAALASGIAAPLSSLSALGWKLSLGIWSVLALLAILLWLPTVAKASPAMPEQATKRPSLWKSPLAWQVSLFMMLQTLVFYTLIDWFPAMALENGTDASTAGLYLFAYQVIAVLANLLTSVALKRSKDQRLIGLVCSLSITVGLLGLLLLPSLSLLWLLFAGAGAGMSMVTCLTLFGLRTAGHLQAGVLSGMAQCVGYLLGATGPYLAGSLHAFSGSWSLPLLCLVVASLIQAVFAFLAGRNKQV